MVRRKGTVMIEYELFDNANIEESFEALEKIIVRGDYYLIDMLPKKVTSVKKYDQFELIFDNKNYQKKEGLRFDYYEGKFLTFFKKLWLYNTTRAYVMTSSDKSLFNERMKPMCVESIAKFFNQTAEVTDLLELESLIKLGTREVDLGILVFEEIRMVCWLGNGLNFATYFYDMQSIGLLNRMTMTEGIYLYRYENNHQDDRRPTVG